LQRNCKGQTAQKAQHGSKAVPGIKAASFLFEEINSLKKQLKPVKTENPKKRKAESHLSTEINLTNRSDEMEECFLFPSTISRSSTKLVENSHPTTKLAVTLNFNQEKHVLRALADTGASSSINLETYTSKDSIKQNIKNKTTWSTMNGQFTTDKTGIVNLLASRVQSQEANYLGISY
jgi:hypothetical protein